MTNVCLGCSGALPPSYLKCPKCGWKRTSGASAAGQLTLGNAAIHQPSQPTSPLIVGSFGISYAGFWRRVAAVLVDSVVLALAQLAINILLSFLLWNWQLGTMFGSLVGVVIAFFYEAYFLSSARQATPGKMALGIRVIDDRGHRISFWKALGRSLLKICNVFTAGLGYLAAAFTPKKQALHDYMVGTIVIK